MKVGFFLFLSILLFSCASVYTKHKADYQFKSIDGRPDFSNLNYWAAHPWKHDPSDSVPSSLKEKNIGDSTVDVFFLYPTSYTDKEKPFGYNAAIDDAKLNIKTDFASILYQASIFNVGRVFAPRYRQANYFAYFPTSKDDTIKALAAFDTAYLDIKAAFEFYLKNYNKGRPIVIAAHSQGTTHAKRLMKEFFDGKKLQQKLVVAYLVGMPVELNYFTNIIQCNNVNQTGCFCSWRTFEDGFIPPYVQNEKEKIAVTNPLTWDSTKNITTRKDNAGAILKNFNKIKKGVTNANTENGFIWAKHPKFFGSFLIRTKNYHIADYNFYYLSVRNNVLHRIKLFWKK